MVLRLALSLAGCAAACVFFLGNVVAAPAPVRMALRDDATVQGPGIVLADLVVVDTEDGALKKTLDAMPLGTAPRVGQVERVTREQLEQAVQRRIFLQGQKITWAGAPSIQVRTAGRLIDVNLVAEAAKSHLQNMAGAQFSSFELTLASPLGAVEVPVGKLELRPRQLERARLHARMPVWVDVLVDGALYRSVVVPLLVKARKEVLVARHDMAAGAVVGAVDFEVRQEDITSINADTVVPGNVDDGARIRLPLAAGQFLTVKHVPAVKMLMRGDAVRLVAHSGGIAVETVAYAQADAVVGEMVSVKAGKGGELLSARVVSPSVVKIEER